MNPKELVQIAMRARLNAYAPYSSISVGAALLTENNKIYTGCNIENASYGATNCAERTAVFKAVSEGEKVFKAIAISSNLKDYIFPCGICRQVLMEFSCDIIIYVSNNYGEYKEYSLDQLLPFAFTKD
jgi:cytidine deaminase